MESDNGDKSIYIYTEVSHCDLTTETLLGKGILRFFNQNERLDKVLYKYMPKGLEVFQNEVLRRVSWPREQVMSYSQPQNGGKIVTD